MLHWYYSHFSLAFTHCLLQVYSLFTSSLLRVSLGFYSHFTLGYSVPMFYSHFTPGLLSLYSRFTHTLHHTFVHVYTPFSPGFITLNSMSSHAKLQVCSQFTPGLHTLYHRLSYSTPGVLMPFSGFYSHFSLGLLSPCFGFMHTLPGFTHILLRVYSHLTLGLTHTLLQVYTHTLLWV